jgi:hypothetical protein
MAPKTDQPLMTRPVGVPGLSRSRRSPLSDRGELAASDIRNSALRVRTGVFDMRRAIFPNEFDRHRAHSRRVASQL